MENCAARRYKILFMLLTAGAMTFAFIHSSMPSEMSASESEGVMDILQRFLNFLGLGTELTDHIVRKAAHFTEYFGIGILLMCCCYTFDKLRPYRFCAQAAFCGLAAAVCDEAIQLNVPGRSGQITDVILDFCGVLCGACLTLAALLLYGKFKRGKSKQ